MASAESFCHLLPLSEQSERMPFNAIRCHKKDKNKTLNNKQL